MATRAPIQPVLRFGAFDFNAATGELRKNGLRQKLRPQASKVLLVLLNHEGQLVTRDQLKQEIWGNDVFVDFEHGLNLCIRQIRAVLNDDAERPRYIETVPRGGYRFIARVEEVSSPTAPSEMSVASGGTPLLFNKINEQLLLERIAPGIFKRRWKLGVLVTCAALLATLLVVNSGNRLLHNRKPVHIDSLAVLPLENLSHDAEQDYFADGMTDELITALAQIHSLRVISRASVMQYKGKRKSVPQIAQELKVAAVLEGTVIRSGDRVRITAQLIDGSGDRHLWAESYESDLRDILRLQDEVAQTIAGEIRLTLLPQESSKFASAPVVNEQTYDVYLKGRYFWNKRNSGSLKKALEYFEQVPETSPSYARAQAGIADTYSLLATAGYDVLPRSQTLEKARAAALRALQIDSTLAEAHASLAFVLYSYDWAWVDAENEFRRAIAINPSYVTAHQWYSELLNDLGRREEARREAEIALALDPLSLNANQNLARTYYFARNMDDAIATTAKTLEMDSSFAIAHLRLGRAYAAKGLYPQAIQEFQRFSTLSADEPLATASIGNALGRSGDQLGALRAVRQLHTLQITKPVPAICFALVYIGMRDNDRAIAWLEKAYEERSDFLLVMNVDPLFDSLRSDPRFQSLLHRLGLSAT